MNKPIRQADLSGPYQPTCSSMLRTGSILGPQYNTIVRQLIPSDEFIPERFGVGVARISGEDRALAEDALRRLESRVETDDEAWATTLASDFAHIRD